MERLEIIGNKPEGGVDKKPRETWNTLLDRFPPFKSLETTYVGPVLFSQSVCFVALVDLCIVDAYEVNFTTIMAVCPNLRCLSIYSMQRYLTYDVSGTDAPRSTPHNLHSLKVGTVNDFPWDGLGPLPSLSKFHFLASPKEPETPQAVIDFIQAYTSLTSVTLHVVDPRLVQLALAAPQLTNVVIISLQFNLELFLDWKAAGMDGPPFPALQAVGLRAAVISNSSLDLQTFEAFVRTRCLPNSHPECALEMGLHPVRQLHIWGEGKLLKSKYIDGATLCEISHIDGIRNSQAILSWV